MALPKKIKTETLPLRFNCILFGDPGVGKTHFCSSFPDAFYINTEKVSKYAHFKKRIVEERNGYIDDQPSLEGVVSRIKELINEPHDYKTLVIDSLSYPLAIMAQMEMERLKKESKKNIEGNEFGSNKARGTQQTIYLGLLLDKLDMNIIILCHEIDEYADDKAVGKIYDCTKKLEYSIPTSFRMIKVADKSALVVRKSTYPEFKRGEMCILNEEGYEFIKKRLPHSILDKSSHTYELATEEQIMLLTGLIQATSYDSDKIQSFLKREKVTDFSQLSKVAIQKAIDHLSTIKKGE